MKISTSGNLSLASFLCFSFSSSTDSFVNPSPLVTKQPLSVLKMGYLDALGGSSGINNRGNSGGGGMGSNPPAGQSEMPYNTPGMGSNPPASPSEQMPNHTPVTTPPPTGNSNGDYDQRRRGSEMGASAMDSNAGPSYSSYMDGRGSVGTGGMNGGNGMGANAGMSSGMQSSNSRNAGMNGQNMNGAGMNDGMNSQSTNNSGVNGAMNGAGNQNGFQNNNMGGGVNIMHHGMDYGKASNGSTNMNTNRVSPQSNPYMHAQNHESRSANTRGGNMNANNPRTMNGGYERNQNRDRMDRRGLEMNHNGNMDMGRRSGHNYYDNGDMGNGLGGTSALTYYGDGGMVDRYGYYRYDNGNDNGHNGGFGTNSGGGYPMAVSYDQYGGLRLGGRYYYGGSNDNCFDIDTNNAGSGYGIRQMGYWDILRQRASRGRKFTPGTGSRYNGRGVLVDSENMGPRAVGYPGSNQSQFGSRLDDRGYYNNF